MLALFLNFFSMNKLLSLGILSLIAIIASPLADASRGHHNGWGNWNGTGSVTGSGTSGSGMTENLACVRSAVATREASIRTAYVNLNTAILAAFDVRTKSLDTAWTLTDRTARKAARDAAWKVWKESTKTARKAYKETTKTAWNTFSTSTRTCKVNDVESREAREINFD